MYYRTVVSGKPSNVTEFRENIRTKQTLCKYAYACIDDAEIQKRSEEFPFSEAFDVLYENRWAIRKAWGSSILRKDVVWEGLELVVAGDNWDAGMLAKQSIDHHVESDKMGPVDRALYRCTPSSSWQGDDRARQKADEALSIALPLFSGTKSAYDVFSIGDGYRRISLRIAGPLKTVLDARDALRRGAVFAGGVQSDDISFFSPQEPIPEMGLPAPARQS